MKFIYGSAICIGFMVLIGTAGADCDGACMERSLSLTEILYYSLGGMALMGLGVFGLFKSEY